MLPLSLSLLPALHQPHQTLDAADQQMQMVERRYGGGQIALGAVQLLDVARDLAHGLLGVLGPALDVADLGAQGADHQLGGAQHLVAVGHGDGGATGGGRLIGGGGGALVGLR